jgi:hypothetical protein
VFIKIGGQEHLNKRKRIYELNHTNLIKSTMMAQCRQILEKTTRDRSLRTNNMTNNNEKVIANLLPTFS